MKSWTLGVGNPPARPTVKIDEIVNAIAVSGQTTASPPGIRAR
jgi:hypothetical protein